MLHAPAESMDGRISSKDARTVRLGNECDERRHKMSKDANDQKAWGAAFIKSIAKVMKDRGIGYLLITLRDDGKAAYVMEPMGEECPHTVGHELNGARPHRKMTDQPAPPAEAADGMLPARACCASVEREYLGMPYTPTKEEIRLRELAEEYHRRTEEYDRTVCSGPIHNGAIMPADGVEVATINRHAQRIRDGLWQHVAQLGFSRQQWMEAIRDEGLRYRHNSSAEQPGPANSR